VVPVAAEETQVDADAVERDVSARWEAAATEAARPHFTPVSVSEDAAASLRGEEEGVPPSSRKPRPGRFGPVFGAVVHEAIGLVLRDPALVADAAVREAAQRFGLVAHLEDAAADVTRALDALRAEGLVRRPGSELQLEYPVAGTLVNGQLLGGYIDLIAVTAGQITVLDFKTDAPPSDRVEDVYPDYVAQVSTYTRLIEAAGAAGTGQVRCGLVFSADGVIRWVSPALRAVL
jgi:ATP-dependent helicase/nuclease subunit A